MSQFDAFRFDGKRVLVVGGASGMGAAAAQLAQDAGADVIVMDYADVTLEGAQGIHVNLAERESIDTALQSVEGPIHALLACAGVADGTPGIERINFIGHRYLIDQVHRRRTAGARRGDRVHLVCRRPRLGSEPGRAEGVARHDRLGRGFGMDGAPTTRPTT